MDAHVVSLNCHQVSKTFIYLCKNLNKCLLLFCEIEIQGVVGFVVDHGASITQLALWLSSTYSWAITGWIQWLGSSVVDSHAT